MSKKQAHPNTRLVVIEADNSLTLAERAICESIINQLENQTRNMVMGLAANLIATCIHSCKASEREHIIKVVNNLIREQVIEILTENNQQP